MKERIVIKIGGRAASDEGALAELAAELASLGPRYRIALVHGGGTEVTRLSKLLGLEPVFREGIRMTSPAEMDVVDMVLAGKMNKALVRRLNAAGLPAVGICGADGRLFTGAALSSDRTGTVRSVDTTLLETLWKADWLPLIASVSADERGEGLNINADDAALALAEALQARALVYLSDIPGVLKEGRILARLDQNEAQAEIACGTISGGMIPKVRSSLKAVAAGVGAVVIGEFKRAGDLAALIEGRAGTRITTHADGQETA